MALGATLVAAGLATGCGGDAEGLRAAARTERDSTPPPVVRTPSTPYVPTTVVSDGWVGGTVVITGSVPPDSAVYVTRDASVCGTVFTPRTVNRSGAALTGAVVWLEDIRTGKPLPMARRYTVGTERCALIPRVQAGLVGGTLNVASGDRVVNQLVVARGDDALARVRLTGFGQVVPVESALARPGLVTITSDVHPWTRGYVLVFDHPYFAVTAPNGTFTIDGVPPGHYTVKVWHERTKLVDKPVDVTAGGAARVDVELQAK